MSKPDAEFQKVCRALFEDWFREVEERCQQTEPRARHMYEAILGNDMEIALAEIETYSMKESYYQEPKAPRTGYQILGHPVHPHVFTFVTRLTEENRNLKGGT